MDILKRQLQTELPVSFPSTLVADLKGDFFTPLIASVKKEYWAKLGLSPSGDTAPLANPELAGGELYMSKGGSIFYLKVPRDRGSLECGGILKNGDAGEFNAFFDSVKGVAQRELKSRDPEWKNLTKEDSFRDLSGRGGALNPSKEEATVARELEDPNMLRILLKTQNLPSFSTRDVSGVVDERQSADALLERLVRNGLMTKDFVVLCKEKGQQIIKVGSRQAIEETSQKGLKCFLCGKPISEESIEELLSCTDLARKMMYNGYWMPVRIVEGLAKVGVRAKDVVQETDDEIFSLYFFSAGEIVLVAPFDRKLGLSDAYALNAKLSVNDAGMGVLIGTHPLSPMVKEFLVQSNPDRALHFLEGFDGFEEKLEQILKSRQQESVRKIVEPFTQLTPVSLRDLVAQKFFPEEEGGARKSAQPAATGGGKRGKQNRQESDETKSSAEE